MAFNEVITKSKQGRLILALALLPVFLTAASIAIVRGYWQIAILIMGVWAAIALWIISLWFQALSVFGWAVYLFSQGGWLVGLVMLFLSLYLVFAARLTDKQVADTFSAARKQTPK